MPKNYKSIFISSVLSCFLYSLSIYFPLFGGFISFFSPLPLGFLRVKEDRVSTYFALLIALAILYSISGEMGIILYLTQYIIPFLVFIEIFLIGIYPFTSMILSCLIIMGIFYLVFLASFGFSISKVNSFLVGYFQKSVEIAFKNYTSSGLTKTEILEITSKLKNTVKILVKVLPSLMFGFYSAVMIGNFYIIKRSIDKFKNINLTHWQAPFYVVWCFILSGFWVLFFKSNPMWWVGLNILLISSFLFLLQGLCIVEYWFSKYNFSPIMKGIFLFFMFLFQIIFVVIALLGLFDTWFDFRKLNKEESDESNS